ncbi:MAG: hypothetical protein K9G48_12765 [Reyranella sp.]|nr:hypothetical protein [Reyranella sp.]
MDTLDKMLTEDDGPDDARLGLGGNNPPEPTPIERAETLIGNANRWIGERPRIEDADQMSKAEGFILQLRAEDAAAYAAMRAEKLPLEEQINAIGKKYADTRAKLDIALQAMNAKKTAWLQWQQLVNDAEKENERFDAAALKKIADDAAALAASETATVEQRLAAETTQRAAAVAEKSAAKAPEVARVSSDFSTKRTGLRTYWHARLKPTSEGDVKARVAMEKEVLTFFAKDPEGRAAMVAACLAVAEKRAKAAKNPAAAPPGIEFYSDAKA